MIGAVSSSSAAFVARPPATGDTGPQRSRESAATPGGDARAPAVEIVGGKSAFAPADSKASSESGKTQNAAEPQTSKSANGQELTPEEQAEVAKLQARDREVRAHEQAHAAAGGAVAGAPSYSYQTGPDGKQYAVGGEVPIRATASSGNPRQAIAQLQQVARAATAPANPSGQDRAVAAQARAQIAQLQAQLAQESQAKAQEALKSTTGEEPAADAEPESTGLPKLPDLPEIATPNGRAPNSVPPGLERSGATPRGIGASDANPLGANLTDGGGVSDLVRNASASADANEPSTRGPIEVPQRDRGPIAAYQQTGASHSKPPTITGRIISLNA